MFSYQTEIVLGFLSVRNKTSKWCFILFWLLKLKIYIEIYFLTFLESFIDTIC